MCVSSDGLAMQLDTGLVDSQLELGVNAPVKDRIKYRHLATCSPIKQKGFATDWLNATMVNVTGITSEPQPGEMLKFYDYGGILGTNHTFWVSNWWAYATQPGVNHFPAYQLGVVSTFSDDEFYPVSNLNSGNSDLVLLFLQSHGGYIDNVNDPWFSAHQPSELATRWDIIAPNGLRLPDHTASVLGCTHQYQICNANDTFQSCSPLLGFEDIQYYTLIDNVLGFNLAQLNTTLRIVNAISYSTMGRTVGPLGASVLLANNDMVGDASLALPDNQWQLEMANLNDLEHTAFQRYIVEYATGPQSDIMQYIAEPQDPIGTQQCENQIIRRNDHPNFSILAVVLIFVAGLLLLTTYFCLEPTMRKQQQKSSKGQLRNLRWQKDGLLQLQRIGYEANNLGTWKTPEYSLVPITTSEELFDFPEVDELYTASPDEKEEPQDHVFRVRRKPLAGAAGRDHALLFSDFSNTIS